MGRARRRRPRAAPPPRAAAEVAAARGEPAGACVPRARLARAAPGALPRGQPGPPAPSAPRCLPWEVGARLWPPASARGGGCRQVMGKPGVRSGASLAVTARFRRSARGGGGGGVGAAFPGPRSSQGASFRGSESSAPLLDRFPHFPPVFAGGNFKEQQAVSFELRGRMVIALPR